jgi:integrase
MPKRARELTALDVKRLDHPGGRGNVTVAVGGVAGLMLQITPGGGRSWLLRTMVGAKRREIGLGSYPTVTLAQARERGREALDKIRKGVDPVVERAAARAALAAAQRRGLSFSVAVDRFIDAKLDEFRNDKHKKQWRSTLRGTAGPVLGDMPVADIGVSDVLRVLEPIGGTTHDTASRLRGRIERVLAWATVAGHRTGENPARWKDNLDTLLPKRSKVAGTEHHPALAIDDAPRWFAALSTRRGATARALEFLTMTAVRSGEVRGAVWSEFDLDARLWTLPAGRMKQPREHRVPLTDAAVALLRGQSDHRLAESDLVFPGARGKPISDASLSAVMRKMHKAEIRAGRKGWLDPQSGRPAVPHGIRSTFRDWCAERTEYPREMAEIALAHQIESAVERAYRRGDMVERRREMMLQWGRFLNGAQQ